MAIALSTLVQNLDRKDVLEDFINVAKALGLSTTSWQSGEPVYDVLTIFADQIANLWNNIAVKAIRAVFLDYAEGDWLTMFAGTFFETWRNEATFATGTLTVQNQGPGFYVLAVGDIRVQNSAGKTFTNQNTITLPPYSGSGPYPTAAATFQADEAGSASNTPIGDIQAIPISAPTGVVVVPNTQAFLGSDEESDEDLRKRARLFVSTFAAAPPRSAYEAVALSVHSGPNGPLLPQDSTYANYPPVNVNRVRVVEPGNGVVNVYLASPAGAAAGDTSTPNTDVYNVNAAIQDKVVPAGISCTVASATELDVNLDTIVVYVDRASLVTAAEAQADATAALTDYFSKLPIGGQRYAPGGQGYLFLNEVFAKSSESNPGIFRASAIIANITPAPITFGATGDQAIAVNTNQVVVPTFSVTAVLVTQ